MEKKPDLKAMTGKERLGYLWDYYKWVLILAVIAVIVVVSIVRSALTKKNTVLELVFANADTMTAGDDASALFTDFLTAEGFDPKKDEIVVNTGIRILDGTSMSDVYGQQALTTILGSGAADLCVMNEELFLQEASLGAFLPVQFYLSEEEMEAYADRIVWVESDPELSAPIAEEGEDAATGTQYARGVRLSKSSRVVTSGFYGEDGTVLGIAVTSERPELAARLVRTLLEE